MKIQYSKIAVKSISEMDRKTQQRIKQAIEQIPNGDIIALQGRENVI